ncbi:insulin-like growth factor-binding protein-related protein 1 isoform X2 [Argiope bruennichi]|uniref:insulin-like growth factor-binding protein-related protein 1 isoform X2 n=1 Tax=Argiope bruennichi TaxID=94029 RepID=UPI002494E605|nr:insulin-like growth factor-binding protein-related protein 1 isoform X2 [Argiope bruennichi]
MYSRLKSYLEIVCLIFFVHNAFCSQNNAKCGICDSGACEAPRNCLAGLVKDSCNCCYVCGNKEGERCDHDSVPFQGLGGCGANLECRARNDLHRDDPPEAVCVCTQQKPICGSDGVTYDNICQFTEARYSRRDGLRAVSTQPCVERNETRLLVQSQNGPNRDETTSWLLFLSLANEDRGTYICKAENDLGSATATATVHIFD